MNQEELIEQMAKWLKRYVDTEYKYEINGLAHDFLEDVLEPAGLAFIDTDQELPIKPYSVMKAHEPEKLYRNLEFTGYARARQEIIEAGWRKIVPLTKQGETK